MSRGLVRPLRPQAELRPKAPANVSCVARFLALAHKFQGMLDRGEMKSMAEVVRLGRVSRARVTQIMDLLLLAPEIQEEMLHGSSVQSGGNDALAQELQQLARMALWTEQWEHVDSDCGALA